MAKSDYTVVFIMGVKFCRMGDMTNVVVANAKFSSLKLLIYELVYLP